MDSCIHSIISFSSISEHLHINAQVCMLMLTCMHTRTQGCEKQPVFGAPRTAEGKAHPEYCIKHRSALAPQS